MVELKCIAWPREKFEIKSMARQPKGSMTLVLVIVGTSTI
jgi:hypothetical protein